MIQIQTVVLSRQEQRGYDTAEYTDVTLFRKAQIMQWKKNEFDQNVLFIIHGEKNSFMIDMSVRQPL